MASIECMCRGEERGFQRQVEYFMKKAAIAVMSEDTGTTNHAERVLFAKEVLNGTASVRAFAVGVATNATIATAISNGSDVSDSDVEFTVNSIYNAYALAGG